MGVLYSAQEFASYVSKTPISVVEFETTFKRYTLAKPQDILDVCVKCNWIDFQPDGICRITTSGQRLLLGDAEKILRVQVCDLIHKEEPSWAVKIPNGRQEAVKFFPTDVMQCFKEAGLLGTWNEELISWWDKLAIATRGRKNEAGLLIGRRAEQLTVEYETKRTGSQPRWQSLESNFSGYDVLSQSKREDSTQRMIEVKGSSLSRKEAFCLVTRNEWQTAQVAPDYRFHLWCLKGEPYLIDVEVHEMKKHIPSDNAEGKWETTKVQFSSFY